MLDPELPEERQAEVVARTRELVERGGGTWANQDVWGRRKLAEARTMVEEREEFESAETPVDRAEPAPEVDERRKRVHAEGRRTAERMRRRPK